MKMIIVLAALVAIVAANPTLDPKEAEILKFVNVASEAGYKFAYDTSDGTSRNEEGEIKNPGTELEALVVRGTITWIGADGQRYALSYIADEFGYRADGEHLPKAPAA